MVSCPGVARLYAEQPERVLSAEDEYLRWKVEENSQENREEAKAQRVEVLIAGVEEKREAQTLRFATKDILSE